MVTSIEMQQITEKARELSREGWRKVRFGDVVMNVDIQERNPLEMGIEHYIGLDHIDPESLSIKRWGKIEDGISFTRKFVEGQVLFGKRRAYQRKVAVGDFAGICSGDILVFEAMSSLLPELLPFIVQSDSFFEHALRTSAGSLSPRTKWKDIANYEFMLPPKDEQRRIADILWAAETAILAWKDSKLLFDKQFDILREQLVCNPNYPRKQLGECISRITPGKSVLGIHKAATPDTFGVLKVSAVGSRGFYSEENKQLQNKNDFRSEFQVEAEDFLITRCNTRELVGKVCIVKESHDNLMLCDKTLRLDFKNNAYKYFVLETFRSNEVRSQIEAAASGTGGAMKNISQEDIRRLQVPLPEIQEQKRIASLFQNLMEKYVFLEKHLMHFLLLKKLLLHEILTVIQ